MAASRETSSNNTRNLWCTTEMKAIKYNYNWVIHNFTDFEEESKIESPIFPGGADSEFNWFLSLFTEIGDLDNVRLFLNLHSCKKSKVRAKFKFSLLNDKGLPIIVKERKIPHVFKTGTKVGVPIIQKDMLKKKIIRDVLKILCEMDVFIQMENICGQSDIQIPDSNILQDFDNLLKNSTLSDVTFIVDGREFQAHKNILATRSAVFAAMFSHEMTENLLNKVVITDISPDVFREMLYFIYTDKAPKIDQMAAELLIAANKYDLGRLKLMCQEKISINLSIESAPDILAFAKLHSAKELEGNTEHFIKSRKT